MLVSPQRVRRHPRCDEPNWASGLIGMANEIPVVAGEKAWLLSQTDSPIGIRFLVPPGTTRIGRAPDNELVIQGSSATMVSLHHAAIERAEGPYGDFLIKDLESTNGTFVNGVRTTEAVLSPNSSIRLGNQGPELLFVLEHSAAVELNETQAIPESIGAAAMAAAAPVDSSAPADSSYESLLSEGVERARRARAGGAAGETLTIMREALHKALKRSSRRFGWALAALAAGLIVVSGLAAWKIAQQSREKRAIDAHITELETQLQKTTNAGQADRLINELDSFEGKGEQLEREFVYRITNRDPDFVRGEIRRLLAEFGAETYSVPPEFTERVKHYIEQDEGPDRPILARALGSSAGRISTIRRVLGEEHLPEDLAYLPLVESALGSGQSNAGAAGPWQITPATAKALGLEVSNGVDERTNTIKSTRAACRYLRQLILDFGTGSSVMLALAAYNSGPSKVKQAVQKTVSDPIKQRSFWYLYRIRALPDETREYVPKVIAAMVIGRNPGHFGFQSAVTDGPAPQAR
jgi:pSer/pThr/pTyr-binding forkhead associated (FHA) protein